MEIYCREFSWSYYSPVDEGFKCKICELFPAIWCSHAKHKFGQVALKLLGDHPRRTLDTHDQSQKHSLAVKEYEGINFCILIIYLETVNINLNLNTIFSRQTKLPMAILVDQRYWLTWHYSYYLHCTPLQYYDWLYIAKWQEENVFYWIGGCRMANWNIDFMHMLIEPGTFFVLPSMQSSN